MDRKLLLVQIVRQDGYRNHRDSCTGTRSHSLSQQSLFPARRSPRISADQSTLPPAHHVLLTVHTRQTICPCAFSSLLLLVFEHRSEALPWERHLDSSYHIMQFQTTLRESL